MRPMVHFIEEQISPVRIITGVISLLLVLFGWGLNEMWAETKDNSRRVTKVETAIEVIKQDVSLIRADIAKIDNKLSTLASRDERAEQEKQLQRLTRLMERLLSQPDSQPDSQAGTSAPLRDRE